MEESITNNDMAALQTKTLQSGIVMAYRSKPIDHKRPTLVLFHSFLMDSRLYEPQFEDPVYGEYNLIAIDEHGHGGSRGRSDFTFWDTASDGLELLTMLEVDRFFVLGTSQGGFIALRMALLAPERVTGLILVGTNADSETPQNVSIFRDGRDKWCETRVPTREALLGKSVSFGGPEVVGEARYAEICERWISRHAGPQGYDPALNCLCERDSLLERLPEITASTLVLHGTNDKVYSVDLARSWSARLGNLSQFVVVDGGYHYLSFVPPGLESCRKHIPDFIDSLQT
ncbi:putative Alpha/beta hydrolase [Taphrina deformans PYCC 5710]|uniref:Alpha/beta hydrolase n=1 Tax=Taphrina deformans (strain PYCC 5710 / ATCC 11124 / CBS 356.35 / IMI 108563 / JCM 9778 / NBRC 8474) TaxID=1097556 RepID=R4X7Y2_TAPDE|nr:putative Alpha/beta hydrolase [Taphrina deformans PYCC 5710]|eukprot:CCG81352.1 putative Alpha/beta hydrolase [Taphrina deformans PYCC 5710]